MICDAVNSFVTVPAKDIILKAVWGGEGGIKRCSIGSFYLKNIPKMVEFLQFAQLLACEKFFSIQGLQLQCMLFTYYKVAGEQGYKVYFFYKPAGVSKNVQKLNFEICTPAKPQTEK